MPDPSDIKPLTPKQQQDDPRFNVLHVSPEVIRISDKDGTVYDVPADSCHCCDDADKDCCVGDQVSCDGDPAELAKKCIDDRCEKLQEELDDLAKAREAANAELQEAIANSVETKRATLNSIDSDIAWRKEELDLIHQTHSVAPNLRGTTSPVKADVLKRSSNLDLERAITKHQSGYGYFGHEVLATCTVGELKAELARRGQK